jgi:hypothetical protein
MNFITALVFKNLQLSEIQNVLLDKINKNSLSVVELGTGRCTTPTNEIFSFFFTVLKHSRRNEDADFVTHYSTELPKILD